MKPVFNYNLHLKNRTKLSSHYIHSGLLVYLPNGEVEVIDIKGIITETFNVKRKLFEYTYPHLRLILLKHVKKYGGFITLDEYNKLQRAEKKAKNRIKERIIMAYIEFKPVLKKVNLKPDGKKEIVLEVTDSSLQGNWILCLK